MNAREERKLPPKICPYMTRPIVINGKEGLYNIRCKREDCIAWRQVDSEDPMAGGWCERLRRGT